MLLIGIREQSISARQNADKTLNRMVVVHDCPSRAYGRILEDPPANWNQAVDLIHLESEQLQVDSEFFIKLHACFASIYYLIL